MFRSLSTFCFLLMLLPMRSAAIQFTIALDMSVVDFTPEEAKAVTMEGTRLLVHDTGIATHVPLSFNGIFVPFSIAKGVVTCDNIGSFFAVPAKAVVVNEIQCCGGRKMAAVGCSGPNRPLIVLPAHASNLQLKAIQWMHELGHNKGLCHKKNDGSALMFPTPGLGSTTLEKCEHNAFEGHGGCPQSCGELPVQENILHFAMRDFIEGVPYRPDIQYTNSDIQALATQFNNPDTQNRWTVMVTALGMTGDPKVFPVLKNFLERGSGPISSDDYAAKAAVPFALGYLLAKNFDFDIFHYLVEGLNPAAWQYLQWHATIGIDDAARTAQLIKMTILGLAISGRPEALSILQQYSDELLALMAKTLEYIPLLHIRIAGIYTDEVLRRFGKEIIATFNEAIRINNDVQKVGSLSNYYHKQELEQLGFNL